MAYGDTNYTPAVGITVIAECWGAGGRGRLGQTAVTPDSGPGGGGGGYSRKAGIVLTGGFAYLVRVGAPGEVAAPHESLFGSGPFCQANGGANAAFQDPGAAGGTVVGAVGDVKYAGGTGSAFPGRGQSPGGGGGSSAGRAGAGTAGAVTAGGADPGCGGAGGDGGSISTAGTGGTAPGGAGGGGGGMNFGGHDNNPGNGSEGCVMLWEDLGNWPPYGQTPIHTAGTAPGCTFPPVITRTYAYVM